MTSRDKPMISSPRSNGSAPCTRTEVGPPEDFLPRASNAYRTLVEQIPAATHLSRLDHVSSTIYISPQIEAMTGYHPSEWIIDRDLWARLLHPDDRERVIAANARHITTGEPFCQEYRMVTRAGLITWVREEARILSDEHGKPIASQGVILDITHDKSVQEELKESAEVRRGLTRELAGAKAETGVEALLAALNAHDGYTGEHSQAVVDLVEQVARRLSLPENQVRAAKQIALLHDIGKLGIADHVLRKPGPLDSNEWRVMREHPIIGARIVESIAGLFELGPAIRAEHERWDGNGYPDGLSGESIPLESRIAFVCDAYHAMISHRPYRQAMPESAARFEMRRKAGSQFDPVAVHALLAVLQDEDPHVSQIHANAPPMRVIVVDDDASTRMLLRFTLEADGIFAVMGEAGNGAEALAMMRSEQPDAVVIDLSMPVMSGLEAIPKIKQLSPACKILVFTSSDAPDVFREVAQSGADACLGKSASLTEVATILETLCAVHGGEASKSPLEMSNLRPKAGQATRNANRREPGTAIPT